MRIDAAIEYNSKRNCEQLYESEIPPAPDHPEQGEEVFQADSGNVRLSEPNAKRPGTPLQIDGYAMIAHAETQGKATKPAPLNLGILYTSYTLMTAEKPMTSETAYESRRKTETPLSVFSYDHQAGHFRAAGRLPCLSLVTVAAIFPIFPHRILSCVPGTPAEVQLNL